MTQHHGPHLQLTYPAEILLNLQDKPEGEISVEDEESGELPVGRECVVTSHLPAEVKVAGVETAAAHLTARTGGHPTSQMDLDQLEALTVEGICWIVIGQISQNPPTLKTLKGDEGNSG